jgi:hypothetical protein
MKAKPGGAAAGAVGTVNAWKASADAEAQSSIGSSETRASTMLVASLRNGSSSSMRKEQLVRSFPSFFYVESYGGRVR